jgi:hypothetical protein
MPSHSLTPLTLVLAIPQTGPYVVCTVVPEAQVTACARADLADGPAVVIATVAKLTATTASTGLSSRNRDLIDRMSFASQMFRVALSGMCFGNAAGDPPAAELVAVDPLACRRSADHQAHAQPPAAATGMATSSRLDMPSQKRPNERNPNPHDPDRAEPTGGRGLAPSGANSKGCEAGTGRRPRALRCWGHSLASPTPPR